VEVRRRQSPRAGATPAVPQSELWQAWLQAQQPVCIKVLTATGKDCTASISSKQNRQRAPGWLSG